MYSLLIQQMIEIVRKIKFSSFFWILYTVVNAISYIVNIF